MEDPVINPMLRTINERNRAFWDERLAVEAKLLADPETARYLAENLEAEALRFSYERMREAARAESDQKLGKVLGGYRQRLDQVDKNDFIEWVRAATVRIDRIGELRTRAGFVWGRYKTETLKTWYREAMPSQRLKPGRPKK